MTDEELLAQLNESQQKAILHTDGPSLIIAGAGSGKTRTLTYRVAYLLQKGIDAFNILCLTFTNKAATEMKTRIIELVGSEARNVWMGTFHSVCARILRIDGHLIGYPENYTIYDTEDSKNLIKTIVSEMKLDPKEYNANTVLNRISQAKSNLISWEEYNKDPEIIEADRTAKKSYIGNIYKIYQSRLFRAGSMDFDDLLFNVNILLRDFPEVLFKYQSKFKYILVDEYQDTNYSQYLIVKQIAKKYQNISVVGDDAQSIYGFRGANIQNILNFKNDYPDYKQFKLEQNYRSTQNIVNAANNVISFNKDQIHKEIWTSNAVGEKIKIAKCLSDSEEGSFIARSIFEIKMNEQVQEDSFAVLYRTHAQSKNIEDSLRKLNIPYRIYGGLSFYSRKEIKDLLAYYKLIINNADEESLRRVINYPARSIGTTTLNKIGVIATLKNISFWDVISNISEHKAEIGTKTTNAITEFVNMIISFKIMLEKTDAYTLALHVAKTCGLYAHLDEDKTPEGISRLENIEALLNAIREYVDKEVDELTGEVLTEKRNLGAFMQEISLFTDQDRDKDKNAPKVTLMTIHQAKGLEFPYVFVAGLEENLFPSFMSIATRSELEEERRLFYVAMTRAEKRLTVSFAETRYKWGNLISCEKSRFIDEIDEKYVDYLYHDNARNEARMPYRSNFNVKKDFKKSQEKTLPTNNKGKTLKKVPETTDLLANETILDKQIEVGDFVIHKSFGKGVVLKTENEGPNAKASIEFENVGVKQLLLRFANLTVVK